jgi:hypothetical protein
MFRKRSNQVRAFTIAALLILSAVFVVWAMDQASSSSFTQSDADKLEVELVTLRPSGFEPVEIRRPKGSFVLFVEDRSGKDASAFTLRDVKGAHLREVTTKRTRFEWHDLLSLQPGDYLLTSNSSDSVCHLTILP